MKAKKNICVIGGGFSGLTAAYELSKNKNFNVTVIEKDKYLGGLASSFDINSVSIDKFYHHWFSNDKYALELVNELELEKYLIPKNSNTGIYYANKKFRLSSPIDLLTLKPLSFFNRIRLGIVTIYVRKINNWEKLESITAFDWLKKICGRQVFDVIWKPLLIGKFGKFATRISAVWIWNKLKLRGSSRDKDGKEKLIYIKGGFKTLFDKILSKIISNNGKILLKHKVTKIIQINKKWEVSANSKKMTFDLVLVTTHLPQYIDIIENFANKKYINSLTKISYLGNICLVLSLKKSLSKTYWLNINDPDFPFVGIIEHTNLEKKSTYGTHVVYLSKYIDISEKLFKLNNEEFLNYSIPYIKKIFPEFKEEWIADSFLWKENYSQPIVTKNYQSIIPEQVTPFENLFLCTMAQIYPEDRGTNYSIREGKKIAKIIQKKCN
jgi:protoporphyrinogen oxidase